MKLKVCFILFSLMWTQIILAQNINAQSQVHKDNFAGFSREARILFYSSEKKSEGLGCLLSLLIPGSGQIYAQEYGKGVLFMVAGYASFGYFMSNALDSTVSEINGTNTKEKDNNFKISALLFLGIQVWNLVDAVFSVQGYNENLMRELGLGDITLTYELEPLFTEDAWSLAMKQTPDLKLDGLGLAFKFHY